MVERVSNDDFEAFLFKVDGDGLDYAVENYRTLLSGAVRTVADTAAAALTNLTSALEAEAERRGLTVPWD